MELSESPGRRLRVLRQSKGWEIERVATQLHLRPHLVEALEQDRFQDLPGPVFTMGYLRNYARLLGLDPEPLVGAYRAANPRLEPRVPMVSAKGPAKREMAGAHLLVRLVSLGLLLAVVGLLVLWWQNRPEPLPEPSLGADAPGLPVLPPEDPAGEDRGLDGREPSEMPSLSLASGALTLPALAEAALEPSPLASPASQPTDSPSPLSGQGLAAEEESDAGGASPAGGSGATVTPAAATPVPEVAMSFTGPSWVDVRDASGKVILTGEMRKGDRRILKGDPPYSFVIGNTKAATVTVGETPLDLGTRGRGGVARFKLDPSRPQ